MEDTNPDIRSSYKEALLAGDDLLISSVSVFELAYGASKSLHTYSGHDRLKDFLDRPIAILSFDDKDAAAAGHLRADLERRKQPIGAFDTLIAGQALARNVTLITANVREFARIKELRWRDWAAKA